MSRANVQLTDLMQGFWRTAVVHALAKLAVADHLDETSASAAELAEALGVDEPSLYRLLRAAASLGLLTQNEDRFSLTELGRPLRSNSPDSLRGMAMHLGGDLYKAFAELPESVATGKPPSWIKHGPEGFSALNDDPTAAAIFNQSMVDGSRAVARQMIDAYDFTVFSSVVDVGGGYGAVLTELLKAHPQMTGTVYDLPHGQAGAERYFTAAGVAERAGYTLGDFFDGQPPRADCYVLKYIVHDWGDYYAERLLQSIARAAETRNARVLLVERVLPEQFEAQPQHQDMARSDLTMMLWSGKERTEAEYASLLAKADLSIDRIIPLSGSLAILDTVL